MTAHHLGPIPGRALCGAALRLAPIIGQRGSEGAAACPGCRIALHTDTMIDLAESRADYPDRSTR